MKKLSVILMVLVLCASMVLVSCSKKTASAPTSVSAPVATTTQAPVAETAPVVAEPVVELTYEEKSALIYEEVLGEFNKYYQEALEQDDLAARYAYMAIAEAKLLESGVFLPIESNGGNYAISRVVPYSITPVLWGNDSYRYHDALVVSGDPLTIAERDELKALYAKDKGTGKYLADAKAYLNKKGYKLNSTYSLGYSSDPETWDVLATSRSADSEAIINTYDGLYEYDVENTLQPALAESYSVSADELTYTFKIKKGLSWVDSQGRKVADVKADDFVAGMQHMMDAQGGLEYLVGADGCNIKNADAYIYGEITDFSQVGVKAVDDYTLQYTLEAPCSFFMTMLGYGVFAPMSRSYYVSQGGQFGAEFDASNPSYKYGVDPDHIAYCGPYLVTSNTEKNSIIFSANPSYWNRNNINITKIQWLFNDGTDPLKAYKDMKANVIAGAGLNASSLEVAKTEGLFAKYAYISLTDATSFVGFFNVNRAQFANINDSTAVVSPQTEEDAARTNKAMNNIHFRRALMQSLDRGAYEAQVVGEELKYTAMINSYTPGTFVTLPTDVVVKINGKDTSFAAGTFYGAVMQAQLDADGVALKAWNPEAEGGIGSSSGYDGWYNPTAALKELDVAVKELGAQGVTVDAAHPIYLDLPYFVASASYANRANALKQSVENVTGGKIMINLVPCNSSSEWYYAGYYTDFGYEANYDIYDVSGWGPDYGDPQSYLGTMLPDYSGYMVKCLGIF